MATVQLLIAKGADVEAKINVRQCTKRACQAEAGASVTMASG